MNKQLEIPSQSPAPQSPKIDPNGPGFIILAVAVLVTAIGNVIRENRKT
jgi:hypothetical protein